MQWSGSSSKETLRPTNGIFLLTAKRVISNAVTKEKMEMQGLRREDGTTLQMHRFSLGQLRALQCAVYDQYAHAGNISWCTHRCTDKTILQDGDTRTATLKSSLKHVLGLLPECWHCHQRIDVEGNYLHLSLSPRLSIPWCW